MPRRRPACYARLIGVADRERAPLVAAALAALGVDHALVVHGRIGMDEIAPQGTSDVWEVRDGVVTQWELDPGRYGLAIGDVAALAGGRPAANAARIERLLEDGAADTAGLAALLLNAGGALYVAGLADSYGDGVVVARDVVRSGKARAALERLRRASPSTSE
jgi:anthranilate phosphoribosyltransferase